MNNHSIALVELQRINWRFSSENFAPKHPILCSRTKVPTRRCLGVGWDRPPTVPSRHSCDVCGRRDETLAGIAMSD